ncbi:MarR family transcriptional regulator [Nocardioides mangrovicus]|uniref:MarR family transcriptional regulator n=2 Tax=Nocardioides mangrovicus TaxID=2478913 RepID=A0A3L8P7A0_9ACTN|nr:MarR family transcriptional regulator [Nocardioides mangrovicus]
MTFRLHQLVRHLRATTKAALAEVGLQDFEYDTLHRLMIRETPGRASPGELAQETGVSNAGMTGRLDSLEKKGWLKRVPGTEDRRRVDVEITRAGMRIWNRAMNLRGRAEDEVGSVLSARELATLNRLLRKMTLYVEDEETR